MRTSKPLDYSQRLSDLLPRLAHLERAVAAGNGEEVARLAAEIDWRLVGDEMEAAVARCCYAIERQAGRIIRNLLRPYLVPADVAALKLYLRVLAEAFEKSPSLHDDADTAVAAAWRREIDKAELRCKPVRIMPPLRTVDQLCQAAAIKIAIGDAAASGDREGMAVDEAAWARVAEALRECPDLPQESILECLAGRSASPGLHLL